MIEMALLPLDVATSYVALVWLGRSDDTSCLSAFRQNVLGPRQGGREGCNA
jgi:hypothetical protein